MSEALTIAQTNLQQAEAALESLRSEQREIPGKIKQAALDGGDVVSLKLRLDELPARIFGAEVSIRRARVAIAEAELSIAREKHQQANQAQGERGPILRKEIDELQKQIDDKALQLRHVLSAETAAAYQANLASASLDDRKRELQYFIDLEISGEPKPARVQVVGSQEAQWSAARSGALAS